MAQVSDLSTRAIETELTTKKRKKLQSGRKQSSRSPLTGLVPLALLLIAWQIFGTDESVFLPRPSTWVGAFLDYAKSGELVGATHSTLQTFVIALLIATVLGTALGILVGRIEWCRRMLNPTLEFIRAIPSSAKVPVFVLLIGYTQGMKLTVVVIAAIFPILLNVSSGVREMNPLLFDVGRTLGISKVNTLRKIVLPSLLTSILTGIRVGAPTVLIVVLVVEILTKVPGLGASLSLAQANFESSLVYALIVVTTILALLVNWVVGVLDDYFSRHLR